MFNILTLNKIAAVGTDLFDTSRYNVGSEVGSANAVLVRSASMHDYEFGGKLLAVARAGAGVNNIPTEKCTEKGIVVFNTPGANANAVKELVIGALFMVSRNIPAAIDWAKTLKGRGDEVPALVEKGKGQFVGAEIAGKKLGVIGLGAIGVLVANAAVSLGMEVYGSDPYLSVGGALQLSRAVHYTKNVKELYENCDYITLHAPVTPDTKGMINAEVVGSMKKHTMLLNFARGDLIEDNAVLSALESGGLGGYITDFPSDSMIGVPKVIAIPHLGASSPESEDNCAVMAAQQTIDYLENGNIKNSVNLPNLSMPITGDFKVCVIHKNEKSVLAKVTGVVSGTEDNIENMESKSKKDVAYTVLDVTGDNIDSIKAGIKAIPEVARVRVVEVS